MPSSPLLCVRATKVPDTEYALGAEIAHARLTGAELKAQSDILVPGEEVYTGRVLFEKLYVTDENGGEVEVQPVVDTAVGVVFTGWNTSFVEKFALYTNEQIKDEEGYVDQLANSRIETTAMWTGGSLGSTAKAKYKNFAPPLH